jgi:hypothetical protein
MAGAQPNFSGNCFYAGGGTFRAQVFGQVWDPESQRNLKMCYGCNDPLVSDLLRQAFEFLVSSDEERQIGDRIIRKMRSKGLPVISIDSGRTTYELTQSKSGSGAARLQVFLPFSTQGDEIDLSEIAKEVDLPDEEETA